MLKIGDIMYSTWGYDQTNVDFYRVAKITKTGKSVTLVPIGQVIYKSENPLAEYVIPSDNKSGYGAPITRRIKVWDWNGQKKVSVKLNSYASASLWNGTPILQTHYH
jgi:hypothetical protein